MSSHGGMYCPSCERTYPTGEYCPEDATRLVSLAAPDTMIGRVLDGRYTLVGRLGGGGMGIVYRATQHSVGRDVAVKVIAANLVSDAIAIKRFLREAKLASRLAHPNAVGVLDFGQTPDHVFYLVMELVEGRTLETVLMDEPALSPKRAIRIAMQICDALEGAHRLQIVHRDLKPANVMVLASGRDLVKVLDFGIARSLLPTDTKMTHTGAAVGTPAFMPPEVASGEEVDGRADLYSLGCMLYLMLTGRLPFAAANSQEMLAMHVTAAPAPMYGVPEPLAAVALQLLEKAPPRRFPTAAATREALEAAEQAIASASTSSPSLSARSSPGANTATTPLPGSLVDMRVAATAATAEPAAAEPAAAEPAAPRRRSRALVVVGTALITIAAAVVAFVEVQSREVRSREVQSPEADRSEPSASTSVGSDATVGPIATPVASGAAPLAATADAGATNTGSQADHTIEHVGPGPTPVPATDAGAAAGSATRHHHGHGSNAPRPGSGSNSGDDTDSIPF